jgi:hypothetical protein
MFIIGLVCIVMNWMIHDNKIVKLYEVVIGVGYAQDEDSGHRIPHNPAGNRWHVEAVFRSETVHLFSGGFLPTSCVFR